MDSTGYAGTEPATSMTEQRLFVYGTLRAGEALADYFAPDQPRIHDVWVEGAALYVPAGGRGWYPFLQRTGDPADVVLGEIVVVPADDAEGQDALYRTLRMEQGAGYDVQEITVHDADGGTQTALCCVYRNDHNLPLDRIAGDWLAYEGSSAR